MNQKTVFISYSHDSEAHRQQVLSLSERLRADGITTILDRYVKNSSPPEGWPRWMMSGLNAATHVLCVCTETYNRRFLGQEAPGIGKGVDWEGALITQNLYDTRSHSNKFIPVLFSHSDKAYIIDPLGSQTHYVLDSDESYQALYDVLLDQAGVEPGTVGEQKRKPRASGQPLNFGERSSDFRADISRTNKSESNADSNPNSKFHGKHRNELLNYFAIDWLPNGPPVAILQGFPGCGKTQLALAVAANAPHILIQVEPPPDAQDPSLDILIDLAEKLDGKGITDLMDAFEKAADGDLFNALLKVLRRERILIIIDEFQRLFANRDTLPPIGWQQLVENLNNSSRPAGRLLLISNRAVKKVLWCENCVTKELKGLTDTEATDFLYGLLKSKDLTAKVPTERLEEICHRLDGNPRALATLVESLVCDSLEDLLSLAPDLFNTGDVEINHELVEDFERGLIERTLSRMEGDLLKFMRWIAVHRRPFKKEAFSEFPSADAPAEVLRKQLIYRFLLENTPSGDSMHPLAREISVTRLRDEKAEWKQAHNLAANYHFRHFKAIQVKGAERCITSYAELRHHLFEAGRISELYLASDRLAQFTLSQIPKTTHSQVPTNVETLEERIALISALPEDSRPKGLEYHLALCLKHRNTGDDYRRALFHVRRAVGPHVYYAVWLLLIELEYSLNGVDAMLKAQDEALKYLGSGSNAFAIYRRCADLLGKDNKLDAAINVLGKGISTPGAKCLSPLISLCSRYMEETGRYDDAIRILKKCIDTPNTPELWKVYVQCAKLMAQMSRSGEAAALLQKGLTVSGMTSLQHLYLLLAKLMVIDRKDNDVIRLLIDGISDARVIEKKDIYCLCAELLVKNNRVEEATALLENGISSKSIKDPVPLYHKFATIMEESGNTDGGVKFLKGLCHTPLCHWSSLYILSVPNNYFMLEILMLPSVC